MPRNMSFFMTTDQIRNRRKWVTRRLGWWHLKPGDRVMAVVKSMGLKKGEKIEPLAELEIVNTRGEPLNAIDKNDVELEGFPNMTPDEFVNMLTSHYGISSTTTVNRIAFIYVD